MAVIRSVTARFSQMPIMLLVTVTLCLMLPVLAHGELQSIDWESLSLSPEQRSQLNNLDMQWKSAVSDIVPKIHYNEGRLKTMMCDPHSNEQDIFKIQKQIHEDKAKLRLQATQIFLNKRKVLNPDQREKLHQMLTVH